jgi:hypothetical protein
LSFEPVDGADPSPLGEAVGGGVPSPLEEQEITKDRTVNNMAFEKAVRTLME